MKRTVILKITILVLALLLAACASASPAPAQQAPAPQTGGSTKEVKIINFAFDPSSLTIPVGTTVKWTNQDSAEHTVTAADNSFDSGQLGQGKTFSFTFSKAGTYPYKCSDHTSMLGKIIVTP